MLINNAYEAVNILLNKDQRGKISPIEFNGIVNQAQNKVTAELLPDYKKLILRQNRFNFGSGFAKQPHFNIQAIEYYLKKEVITDRYAQSDVELPEDTWFFSEAYTPESLIEKLENNRFNLVKRSNRMKPNDCFPVCTLLGSTLSLFPAQKQVEIHYLRKPKAPKWTFEIIGDEPIFNPDKPDFQDIDVHHSLISTLFIEIVQMCGINLREADIEQYIALMKQEAMAKQNSM